MPDARRFLSPIDFIFRFLAQETILRIANLSRIHELHAFAEKLLINLTHLWLGHIVGHPRRTTQASLDTLKQCMHGAAITW